jgi:CMP-N-acetylneuraminic acid synthetase|tara:strand:+ start:292 stop:1020 length:729 start_codon:yes stop_codon:yes gene_type:complete
MKFLDQIWCFIPARSGSSLKDKNIKKLKGKPLIYYSIKTAFESRCFDNVIFSSDSNKYIEIALKINKNLEIHKRNAKISSSTASEYSVFKDYINLIAAKKKFLPLYFAHLRPTNPIRNINTIKKVIKKFKRIKDQFTCLRMLNESSKPAFWSSMVNKNNRVYTAFNNDFDVNKLWLTRQSFEKTYFINCHIDIYKTKNILRSKSLWGNKVYGYIDNDYSIVDIDTIEDFKYAEYLMSQKKKL